jgi:hypothetical protein
MATASAFFSEWQPRALFSANGNRDENDNEKSPS